MDKAAEINSSRTALDLGREKIVQFSLAVKDTEKVAKCFSRIFGISWKLYDLSLSNSIVHGKELADKDFRLKIAIGSFGGRSLMKSLDVAFAMGELGDIQIEIITPIGPRPGGCHQVFLDRQGNGIQHVSFGIQPDYGEFVDRMKIAGYRSRIFRLNQRPRGFCNLLRIPGSIGRFSARNCREGLRAFVHS